jgi:hypothetical protein
MKTNVSGLSVADGLEIIRMINEALARGEQIYTDKQILTGVLWLDGKLYGAIRDEFAEGVLAAHKLTPPLTTIGLHTICPITEDIVWAGDLKGDAKALYVPKQASTAD